jgi:hypothetical protein
MIRTADSQVYFERGGRQIAIISAKPVLKPPQCPVMLTAGWLRSKNTCKPRRS